MTYHSLDYEDEFSRSSGFRSGGEPREEDLWFLPSPLEDEPDLLAPLPRGAPAEEAILCDWAKAEAGHAARLARVAGRLGVLDERLRRGPDGWRQRLALIEAAELSWFTGDRIPQDRLALWSALRISSVQDDARALARAGWAVRRLSGGPGPMNGLPEFLGRHDPLADATADDRLTDRTDSWLALMETGCALHPITRAGMGFHAWGLAGLGEDGNQLEAAVTAARIAASDGDGAVFAPVGMGGAGGLRASGDRGSRLGSWLDGMESGIFAALRHLEQVEAWADRAETAMAELSGRTPALLRTVLAEQPLLSAPMAEAFTGASRAAVQRNLAWMEARRLVHEITGQGRFRFWRAAV